MRNLTAPSLRCRSGQSPSSSHEAGVRQSTDMNRLRRISGVLAKVPSMGYALAYLTLIPTFALAYWMLPQHFFHSTIQYESTLDADAEVILQELRNTIIDQFRRAHEGDVAIQNDWSINIGSISMGSLKSEEDRTRFTMRLEFWGVGEREGIQAVMPVNVYIENRVSYASYSPGGELVVFKSPEVMNASRMNVSPSIIFPLKPDGSTIPVTEKADSVWLAVSGSLQERIAAFTSTVKGLPKSASGAFARMFYFSAVTITTLGYGDIVPITNPARILVALESIFGIVLIGLFLNSLSREYGAE